MARLVVCPSPSLNNCQNVLWIAPTGWEKPVGCSKKLWKMWKAAPVHSQKDEARWGQHRGHHHHQRPVTAAANSSWGLDTIFSYYDAYPGVWLKERRACIWFHAAGSQNALSTLRRWYAEGILDREFAVRDESARQSLIGKGQCGMYFGVWWPSNGSCRRGGAG